MEYPEFFQLATGKSPLFYQERFHSEHGDLKMLRIPTGLGKTDTVLVDWLYRRPTTRLVWILPGRALTEQVASVVCDRLDKAGVKPRVQVCVLMGGSEDNDLTLGPEQPAILISTQDMALSRALNRGYARRAFRWPIDFALLNNDCYWVLDEVQLLGDGLATSTQLAAFRDEFGTFGKVPCCWMSATFNPRWLDTVNFAGIADSVKVIELNENDRRQEIVKQRVSAAKRFSRAPDSCRLPSGVAEFVVSRHRPGSLSIMVANTVARAREIWAALRDDTAADLVLLHSRFRAAERASHVAKLRAALPPEGRIIVATQVIEAGIDISASLMVSDIAPYASMVQRFGRVNRYGKDDGAEIYWVDRPLINKQRPWAEASEVKPKEQERIWSPYGLIEVEQCLNTIADLGSAAPDDLPVSGGRAPWNHVLRRNDLLDLFDTTPDLAGNEIDISRFVRSGEDRDVYLFWRDWETDQMPKKMEIEEAELCPVPIGEARDFAKKHTLWAWDALKGEWKRLGSRSEDIYPGLTLLAHVLEGGYSALSGWSPESKDRVEPVPLKESQEIEPLDDDRKSFAGYRQTLIDHTDQVCSEMRSLIDALTGIGVASYTRDLNAGARKHDWGKTHFVMQNTLHNGQPYSEFLAKQERCKALPKHCVPFFRHEFASTLAMLQEGESDLAAYIAAAHHGRVRMSLRSMPGERGSGKLVARGIRDQDILPVCDLGGGVVMPEIQLRLDTMLLGLSEDGMRSWTDRMLRLRDKLGPFRMAYLEMLLRIADERASKAAKESTR